MLRRLSIFLLSKYVDYYVWDWYNEFRKDYKKPKDEQEEFL